MSVTVRVDNEGKHASWSGGSSAWERLPKQVSGLDFNENTCISPLSFCVCSLGSWGKPGSSRGWERSGRMLGSQQLIPGLLPAWSALSRHISTHIAQIYQTNSETISHHIPSYPIWPQNQMFHIVSWCFYFLPVFVLYNSSISKPYNTHSCWANKFRGVRLIAWGYRDYLQYILAQVFFLFGLLPFHRAPP